MHYLIRRVTNTKAGKAFRDTVVETDTLTIGRATNQNVFLSDLHVALEHAVVYALPDGRYSIKSKTTAGLHVNGKLTQADIIRPGDNIVIGRSAIRLLTPEKDQTETQSVVNLVLEVTEIAGEDRTTTKKHSAMSLHAAGLRKRPIAWLLFLLTLGACLVLPLSYSLWSTDKDNESFVSHVLPDDSIWESGQLSGAHAFFGEQCKDCHQQPFVMVKNTACLECHKTQPAHSDSPKLLKAVGLNNMRCANCHREHNGPRGVITRTQALCTDCHNDTDRMQHAPHPTLVNDFGTDHPEFRLQLLVHEKNGWTKKRVKDSVIGLQEKSNLIFPHDEHLNPEGIEGPYGSEVLACASCHQPETGNIAMQPINMEKHCMRCHQLSFEPSDPKATVPHGDVAGLHDYLQQYYSRVALQGGYKNDSAPTIIKQRRLPGEALQGKKRTAALQWANQKAASVADEVFAYRICTTCHEISKENDDAWDVAPVKLNQDWMPAARYTHAPHLTMQCTDCHAADVSKTATDVLMPTITQCQDCHGGEHSDARVASSCVACHKFHQAKFYLIGKDVELDDDTGLLFKR